MITSLFLIFSFESTCRLFFSLMFLDCGFKFLARALLHHVKVYVVQVLVSAQSVEETVSSIRNDFSSPHAA